MTVSILLKPLRFTKVIPIFFKYKYIALFIQAKRNNLCSNYFEYKFPIHILQQRPLGNTPEPTASPWWLLEHSHYSLFICISSGQDFFPQTFRLICSLHHQAWLRAMLYFTKTFPIQTLLKRENKTKTSKKNNTL